MPSGNDAKVIGFMRRFTPAGKMHMYALYELRRTRCWLYLGSCS